MDESRVVPKGSHFARPYSHDGTDYNLTWEHRCCLAPVDYYYYINFVLSGWYPDGHDSALAIGVVGQVKTVPELSDTIPYNPFKVDIYQLGYTVLEVICVSSSSSSNHILTYTATKRNTVIFKCLSLSQTL